MTPQPDAKGMEAEYWRLEAARLTDLLGDMAARAEQAEAALRLIAEGKWATHGFSIGQKGMFEVARRALSEGDKP